MFELLFQIFVDKKRKCIKRLLSQQTERMEGCVRQIKVGYWLKWISLLQFEQSLLASEVSFNDTVFLVENLKRTIKCTMLKRQVYITENDIDDVSPV